MGETTGPLQAEGERARPAYMGRLELTWTNKHLTLLAHEDQTYEWVDPADYRVSEVRLLHDVATVGHTAPSSERATDNLLIRGDALHALNALTSNPEFAREYAGKVKLVYIDPPFNTGQAFTDYDDALEHSVWLTMLRDRLVQIRDLLAPDGSVWVHLDDEENHRARAVLDELFGPTTTCRQSSGSAQGPKASRNEQWALSTRGSWSTGHQRLPSSVRS